MTERLKAIGRYALAAAAGAVGGALLTLRLTNILPRLMAAMMETMHGRMEAAGINPAEI